MKKSDIAAIKSRWENAKQIEHNSVLALGDIKTLLCELQSVTAERDAAIAHIAPSCSICAKDTTNMCPGRKCFFQGYEYFEWRGTEATP